MSTAHRPWTPPENSHPGFIGRDFPFPDSLARDPDEIGHRDHVQALLSPILAKLTQKGLPEAIRTAQRLCAQQPGNVLYLVEQARLLLATGAFEPAEHLLAQILEHNPQHLEAIKMQGYAHLQQGDLPQALDRFMRAVQRGPADSFSQINLHAVRTLLRRKPQTIPATSQRPVVATSLPPRGVEVGQDAVGSWLERGFRVISVNTPEERDHLAPSFPGVEFHLCSETAKPQFGKDYQYLDALLDALDKTGEPICGIVNADIILRGEPAAWDQFCAAAATKFVYGSRVNVRAKDDPLGRLLEPGFDYFFFPKELLTRIPRTGFIIGQPAWDVFLPAWVARLGFPRAFCYSPLALHVEHPVQWSRTSNSRFLTMAISWFAPDLARLIAADKGCHSYLRLLTAGMAATINMAPKAGAEAFFCSSPKMDNCIAPLDPFYWLHGTEETLVLLSKKA